MSGRPRIGWCPSCRRATIALRDGLCGWCERPVRFAASEPVRQPPRRRYRRRVDAKLSDRGVDAAYRVYLSGRSVRWIAKRIYERHGFASARSCATALWDAFRLEGYPLRDRIEATIAASTTHGELAGCKDWRTPEAKRRKNAYRRRRRGRRPCKGVKTRYPRKGSPCPHYAEDGSDYCYQHNPDRKAERDAHLAAMRAKRSPRVRDLPDPVASQAAARAIQEAA